ncbi:hypothetical protein [Actinomadura napierensis]
MSVSGHDGRDLDQGVPEPPGAAGTPGAASTPGAPGTSGAAGIAAAPGTPGAAGIAGAPRAPGAGGVPGAPGLSGPGAHARPWASAGPGEDPGPHQDALPGQDGGAGLPPGPGQDSGRSMGDAELLSTSPFDGDLDAELTARPKKRSLPGPTLYLGAGIVLVAGFLGGVQAEKWKSDDSGSPGGGPAAAGGYGRTGGRASGGYGGGLPGQAGAGGSGTEQGGRGGTGVGGGSGAGPGGGFGGGFGGGGMTAGTVTKIVGNTLYLRTSDGKTVKVKTSGSTRISITKDGKLGDLGSGVTVVVRGTTGKDGSVTATTVNQGSGR